MYPRRCTNRRSLNAHLALLVMRQAELVEGNVIPKRVGQGGFALRACDAQSLLRCCNGLGKPAALSASSRESPEISGIFPAGKLHGLFGELDCPIPIANRSIGGGREEPRQIAPSQRILRGDPCRMLVLG